MSSALHVSFAQWAGIGVFLALAILASTRIGAVWRGEILAEPTRWNRSAPAWFATAWLMILALPLTLFVTSQAGPVSPWLTRALLLALTAVAVSALVASFVWLTGHPRGFVPPRIRRGSPTK